MRQDPKAITRFHEASTGHKTQEQLKSPDVHDSKQLQQIAEGAEKLEIS
jgi:hypothetical protein